MDELAPPAVKLPGIVVKNIQNNFTYYLDLKLTPLYQANQSKERVDIITTQLGGNIYLSDRKSVNTEQDCSSTQNNAIPKCSTVVSDSSSSTVIKQTSLTNKNDSSSTSNATVNLTTNIYNKTKQPVSYLEDSKLRNENIQNVKKEFSQLADLLNVKTAKEDQVFKLDLFKLNNRKNNNFNSGDDYDDEPGYIEIERVKYDKLDKIKGMFDDIDLNNAGEGEDDLLDLMDIASSK
jgi:hypothetical protein